MGYQPDIPQPTDVFPNSQVDILQNFQALDTEFGLEHQPFSTGTGQHVYVTLPQGPTLPALNPGTNGQISQQRTAAPNNAGFVQYRDSTGLQAMMLSRTIYNKSVAPGIITLYDLGSHNMPPCAGTVQVYDVNDPTRTVLSPFAYIGGTVYLPGTITGNPIAGQLCSGNKLVGFIGTGSALQLQNVSGSTTYTVTLKITYSQL